MMRKVRTLGLALVAACVLAIWMAPTAQADEFTAESYPTSLEGTDDGSIGSMLVTTTGSVNCKKLRRLAKLVAKSRKLRLIIEAANIICTLFGFPGKVEANGCEFVLNLGEATSGDVDLECPAGKELTYIASSGGIVKCTVHIKTQTDIGGSMSITNLGSGATREMTADVSLSGIDYTHTSGTGLGSCTAGSATNGTLSEKIVFTGAEGGSHVGVFAS